ncbi:NUDIX domain-containing protein, partial [Rossellomorea marisflavi]
MYKYTLCFIQRNDEILMLNRDKPPVLGLWNGVGGKVADGETPTACILREIA